MINLVLLKCIRIREHSLITSTINDWSHLRIDNAFEVAHYLRLVNVTRNQNTASVNRGVPTSSSLKSKDSDGSESSSCIRTSSSVCFNPANLSLQLFASVHSESEGFKLFSLLHLNVLSSPRLIFIAQSRTISENVIACKTHEQWVCYIYKIKIIVLKKTKNKKINYKFKFQ